MQKLQPESQSSPVPILCNKILQTPFHSLLSNVLHTSSHLDSFLFSHLPLKFFFLTMRHLQCQESQVFRHIAAYPRMAMSLLGKSQKQTPFSQKQKSPKTAKQAFHFLGNRNPHFTGTPKTKSPKISSQKWFWGNSPCSGATPIILKRQSRISSPHFSQK